MTRREITPHKGGRTDRLYVRVTPEIKALAEGATKKKAIENLKKKYESHCFNDGWCLCPKSH